MPFCEPPEDFRGDQGMSDINTDPNLTDPDGFYAELIDSHDGLTKEQSDRMNARLILLLANHIGDRAVLRQAIRLAREAGFSSHE